MTPVKFPEANRQFKAPDGMDESQVFTIDAFVGVVKSGNMDGANFVVTAWTPTPEEIERIKSGHPVYLSVLGGLPPHFLTTDFKQAAYQA